MSGKKLYEERLGQLVEILKSFQPEKIYAYGSWEWGNAGSESDIDLMVVVKPGVDRLDLMRDFYSKLFESGYPYDLSPDVHTMAKDKFDYRLSKGDPFISDVARGKVMYG